LAGARESRQQRAHGVAATREGRSERLHSRRIQARADFDADGVLTSFMKPGSQFEAAGSRRWSSAAILLAVMVAGPLWAQSARVFRDGNAWVEESTGALPAGREFRASTDIGSVQVQGNAAQASYVVRKRSYANTEEAARRQFDQLRVLASKAGDTVV